ncbi:hypothetical protein [Virgibacillus proomii]|uniref:hypothetical protein n=1 Tax=Virgibacillus proomii TaxID=84407 RepID=UPI0011803B22|nr:hypothetical protein [Virgibacillus proomii]
MMNAQRRSKKFTIVFHFIIILFTIGTIIAYARNEFQIAYMIIATIILVNSVYGLIKALFQVPLDAPFTN